MLFDSHAHLNDARFDIDSTVCVGFARKKRESVRSSVRVTRYLESSEFALKLANEYDRIFAVCGLHPDAADGFGADPNLEKLRQMLSERKCVGLGEIGLDYYCTETPTREKQLFLFEKTTRTCARN